MIENFPFAIRFPVDLAYKLGMGEKAFDIFDYTFFYPSGVYSKWINVEYSFPHIVDLYLNMKRRGGTPGSGIQCFEIAESDSHAHTERTSRRRRNMGTPENPVS